MMTLRGIEIRARFLRPELKIKYYKDLYTKINNVDTPGESLVIIERVNNETLFFDYEDIVRVKPTDQMVIAEMKKFGGEFAKRLAFAYEAADSENRHILGRSFSELFQTYAEMAIGNMQNHFA